MKYKSKPTEIEARRWNGEGAHEIVAWVNANGGEARYEQESWPFGRSNIGHDAYIAVRTIDGWDYAKPGHYIVMGSTTFQDGGFMTPARFMRDFYPCDPETFESTWEAVRS